MHASLSVPSGWYSRGCRTEFTCYPFRTARLLFPWLQDRICTLAFPSHPVCTSMVAVHNMHGSLSVPMVPSASGILVAGQNTKASLSILSAVGIPVVAGQNMHSSYPFHPRLVFRGCRTGYARYHIWYSLVCCLINHALIMGYTPMRQQPNDKMNY